MRRTPTIEDNSTVEEEEKKRREKREAVSCIFFYLGVSFAQAFGNGWEETNNTGSWEDPPKDILFFSLLTVTPPSAPVSSLHI